MLLAFLKLTTIGKEAAEGILASRIINRPNKENIFNFQTARKKIRGITINLIKLIFKTGKIQGKDSLILPLANHAPKIIIERGKLVSPIIFRGEMITPGIKSFKPVYTKNRAIRVLNTGGLRRDLKLNFSLPFLKIKKLPTDHIRILKPRI